jgi:hypothetical protein
MMKRLFPSRTVLFCVLSSWVLMLYITTPLPVAFAAERNITVKEVVAIGEASVEQLTPEEARQMARRNARANGIEQAIGTEVSSRTLVRDFSLAGDFIKTLARGYILEEEVVRWDERIQKEAPDKPGFMTYQVTLKMKVAPLAGNHDPYFQFKATLNKNFFVDGEDAVLKVTPTKDCYLTILAISSDDKLRILFPNEYLKKNLLPASRTFTFPDQTVGSLVVNTTADHRRDSEAFILVATKQPLNLSTLLGRDQNITVTDFYKVLLDIPVTEWVEEIIPYEVRKNK